MTDQPGQHSSNHGDSPLFSFGVISDIQYGDLEERQNYHKTRWRYYRNSLNLLKDAINSWNTCDHPVKFVLQLGDLIDGFNRRQGISQSCLDTVLEVFSTYHGPVHHLVGNHELYNFKRPQLLKTLLKCTTSDAKTYYDFSPAPGFRFVVLDSYEVGLLGYEKEDPRWKEAWQILSTYNPNEDKNSPEDMRGIERRFLMYNGSISKEQLQWLDDVLKKAEHDKEWVVITSHQPILEASSDATSLCWNFDDILTTMHRYSCVVAFLCGHDHDGGFAVDDHGIRHVIMPAVLETEPDSNAFGTVHVYPDRMELIGGGKMRNITIPLKTI